MTTPEPAEAALRSVASIPRDADGPVFPAPWAARAFALAVALNARGVFEWAAWSEMLGAKIAESIGTQADDPEAYWRAWLAALETLLRSKTIAGDAELSELKEAWRQAAERTPHGRPIVLRGDQT